MGKGKRAREARAGKREELKIRAAKLRLRQKITKIVGWSLACVAAVAIVAGVTYNAIANTGYFLRNTVAMSSKNFEVDNAMMTYYVKNEYFSFANTYADYLSMYGLDTSKTLKSQSYGDGTWFDYFLSQAKTQVNDLLLCAEQAKADGKKLTDDDYKSIDESIETIKTYAKQNNMSLKKYLSAAFATGINEKDVRRALELSILASNYNEEYKEKLEYTNEDLEKYFEENKSNYVKADYLKYTFDSTNEDKDAAKQESKDIADKLAATKTPEQFKSVLETFLTDYYKNKYEAEAEADVDTKTTESVEADLEAAESTSYFPTTEEKEQTELEKWLFNSETKVNQTLVVEPAEDKTSYTVYMMLKTSYRDDYATANVRHILLAVSSEADQSAWDEAKEKADKLITKFNEGDKTSEAFEKLAKENSEDGNVSVNGGLYEGVTQDKASYPEEFINWSFDSSRKQGDVGVIKTDSGYHVMYFEGVGDIAWKIQATSDKKAHDWEHHIEDLEKEYKVKSNDSDMNKIKA